MPYAPDYALWSALDWNRAEWNKACRDASNTFPVVPKSAFRMVGKLKIPLTADEYRQVREKDAHRLRGNIEHLRSLVGEIGRAA